MTTTHTARIDVNGDGFADLLWRGADGTYGFWYLGQDGRSILGTRLLPNPNGPGDTWAIRTVADINGDQVADLVWQNAAGGIATWILGRDGSIRGDYLGTGGLNEPVQASGDFNGDGRGDLLWRLPPSAQNPDGLWFTGAAEARKIPAVGIGTMEPISADWQFQGVGDFNADGRTDLLFRGGGNATVGSFLIENLNTTAASATGRMSSTQASFADPGAAWTVARLADFNGDGHTDILWLNRGDGTPAIWLMNNNQLLGGALEPNPTGYWSLVDAQDYDGDGKADILWRGQGGEVGQWFMDGTRIAGLGTALPNPGTEWTLLGL